MRFFLLLLSALCMFAPSLSAQELSTLPGYENRPTMRAVRLQAGETISVDGRLDETVWKRATPAGDFVQQDPSNGQPATEKTEVRILFNEHSLYMGVICYDSEPEKIRANQMQRDGGLPGDDAFRWVLDPYLNGTSGYSFATNPNGLMSDSLLTSGGAGRGGGGGSGWDGIWYERVVRSDIGWTIEVEIPFRTLAFSPNAPAWGINFQRSLARNNEENFWNGWGRNQSLQRLTNAGLLEGLADISQGVGLNAQPYAIGKFLEAPPGTNTPQSTVSPAFKGSFGGDLIYSVTPKLKATFTINTDFAETEVDQRQVNLTRFNLFFPERRNFFLEGGNFLGFSREPDNLITPYYSRSIGLDADLAPQRINFGGKITGQVGAYDLGFVQVETANQGARTGEHFTVFRGRRRFLRQSYVGTLFTRRSDRAGLIDTRMTAGTDFSLATSEFRGNQNLELSGFYLGNTNLADTGGNAAYGLRLDYPNDLWNVHMAFKEVPENWNPAAGFVQRRSVRNYSPMVQFAPRPRNNRLIRRYEMAVVLDFYTDLQNQPRTGNWDIELLEVDTHAGDLFSVHVRPSFERPERDFEISKGIILPKDTGYSFTQTTFRAWTAPRRKLAVDTTYHLGTFYSGHQKGIIFNLSARPRRGLSVSADYQWNRVELKEGNFSTRLFRMTVNTQFGPFAALSNNVQYDNVSRVLGWQSRLRWIVKPGNELYLVYSHNWRNSVIPEVGLETLSRNAATKMTYTHQF